MCGVHWHLLPINRKWKSNQHLLPLYPILGEASIFLRGLLDGSPRCVNMPLASSRDGPFWGGAHLEKYLCCPRLLTLLPLTLLLPLALGMLPFPYCGKHCGGRQIGSHTNWLPESPILAIDGTFRPDGTGVQSGVSFYGPLKSVSTLLSSAIGLRSACAILKQRHVYLQWADEVGI